MLVYSTVDSGLTITLSWTTRVSRYHRCKTNLDFTEARVAVASAGLYATLHLAPDRQPRQHPNTQFFTGRMPFLPPNQQRQSTERNTYVIGMQCLNVTTRQLRT